MTLNEWISKNGDREIEFEDGKITVKEPAEEKWPKVGDDYYCLSEAGHIDYDTFNDDGIDFDIRSIGNMFQTHVEAEDALERLLIRQRLKDAGGKEFWEVGNHPFCLSWNNHLGRILSLYVGDRLRPAYSICFKTEAELFEAVEIVGEDRIKKYLFGVAE